MGALLSGTWKGLVKRRSELLEVESAVSAAGKTCTPTVVARPRAAGRMTHLESSLNERTTWTYDNVGRADRLVARGPPAR